MRYLCLMIVVLALVVVAGCQRAEQTGMTDAPPATAVSPGTESVNAPETPPAPATKAGEVAWLTSLEEGMAQAAKENKPLVVDFFATWCGPCRMLDEQTWPDAQVQEALKDYVAVKVDTDQNQELAQQYRIEGIPAIVFMDSAGKEKTRKVGFVGPQEMVELLKANK